MYFFSAAVKTVVVAKLAILGISSLISFTLALREALVAKLVISSISSPILLIFAIYKALLTTSFFYYIT